MIPLEATCSFVNWPSTVTQVAIMFFKPFLILLFFGVVAIVVPHPLDPLSPEEIQATVSIISASSLFQSGKWVFNYITLKEPSKSLLLPYFLNNEDPPQSPRYFPRRSFTVLLDKQANTAFEVVINLSLRQIESWAQAPDGVVVTYVNEDFARAKEIVRADPGVQERCRQMGWTNMSLVTTDVYTVAYSADRPALRNAIRPAITYMYGQQFDGDNHYAHPFDFLPYVDLATGKVLLIDNLPTHSDYSADNRDGNVCPKQPINYNPSLRPPNVQRTDLKPIQFSQPEGPSYSLRGNEVTWQKFKFRVGYTGREGHVIHLVSYQDGPLNRPLFYRLSLVEGFSPHGDARPPFHQKFPFNMAEYTFGWFADNLKTENLCGGGGTVTYIDANVHDETGTVTPLPAAVCVMEEDAGLLRTHWTSDSSSGSKTFNARSQRLTVFAVYNMGSYDYEIAWRFYQDASIEFRVGIHGSIWSQMLAQNLTNPGEFGNIAAPQILGQFSQHNFAIRVDAEIDGNRNAVSTMDVVPLPDPSGSQRNPYGQGFTTVKQLLRTPAEARTKTSANTGRTWLIQNPTKYHTYTKRPTGYRLIPYNSPPLFVRQDSPLFPKAAWADYNVWVTKYQDDQIFPGGFYMNKSGLPEWVRNEPDADITYTDVVLWHVFGVVHIPHTEDLPLMSVEPASVFLKPFNFFIENPAMDVPPPPSEP